MDKSLILSKIESHYNFSRSAEFAKFLGITPQRLSNWKNRNTYDAELIYTKCVGLNPEWLLTGDGEMLKVSQNLSGVSEHGATYGGSVNMPRVITVSPEGDENIIMVPVPAQAGYLDGYGDPTFLEALPTYRLPTLNNGTFRIFEVAGHSMFPTIHSGALAVGEWCEKPEDIKDNNIYIIVSRDHGIVIKRVLNRIDKYNNLYVKSDNRREYPSYAIPKDDILEIWTLKTAFIYDFQDPADMYERVNELEAEMLQLKSVIGQKATNNTKKY